ncbi:hypothetical protein METBIDRAFT_31527 [Metschnikowia bicuspidata var. bicuspidata NRRL YB-4993]|uniref:Uncharacterized protein n=1 Tax=Metschnikowia bicuspidata var. bicuspidata NRRL YB-4993 TaxID=869754 RepID=A0A1A0HA19_9ASCO|nr:hypothetical protein METBIDRAFT_31527 [Metschnikowia bicuspidata var. bicuspidata NRRL YB-4993]OBA20861.1 hypothetical protein METBIDRAFT_31527 [Metschnikowia bicuspidata var. bicuspidata NRRL YB-4993]
MNPMKRPDEFEMFHQRRKRPPLAEVGNTNTTPHRPLRPINHNRQNTVSSSKDLRSNETLKNINIFSLRDKHFSFKPPAGSKALHGNKENLHPLSFTSTSPGPGSLSDNSKMLQKAREMYRRKEVSRKERENLTGLERTTRQSPLSIPLTRIGHLLSGRKLFPLATESHLQTTSVMPSIRYWLDAPQLNKPSFHYRFMQSLVDYNSHVEQSNLAIRSLLVLAKFADSTTNRKIQADEPVGSRYGQDSLCSLTDDMNWVALSRVTELSPFLLAATTSEGEDILLMNTHEADITAGSKISLEDCYTYDLSGVPTKAYYKWQLLH